MEDSGRYVAINATLRRLEQYSTLSPFCRAFYRLIYELLGDPEMDSAKLRQAFHVFLRCECRRHQTVCRIVKDGGLDLEKIIRSGRQTHDLLEWLAARAAADEMRRAAAGDGPPVAARGVRLPPRTHERGGA